MKRIAAIIFAVQHVYAVTSSLDQDEPNTNAKDLADGDEAKDYDHNIAAKIDGEDGEDGAGHWYYHVDDDGTELIADEEPEDDDGHHWYYHVDEHGNELPEEQGDL